MLVEALLLVLVTALWFFVVPKFKQPEKTKPTQDDKNTDTTLLKAAIDGYLVRKDIEKSRDRIRTLQMILRSYLEQRILSDKRNSVTIIQALTRSLSTSRRKSSLEQKISVIQAFIRTYLSHTTIIPTKEENSTHSVETIQSLLRSAKERKQHQILKKYLQTVQSIMRGRAEQTRLKQTINNTIILEAIARSSLQQRKHKQLITEKKNEKMQNDNVTTIQALCRGRLENTLTSRVELFFATVVGAAIRQEFQHAKQESVTIQAIVREKLAKKQLEQDINRITLFQAINRSALISRSIQESKKCTIFQSLTRGRLVMNGVNTIRNQVTQVQSLTRRSIVNKSATKNLSRVILLQAIARGRTRLSKFAQDHHVVDSVAIVQALVRRKRVEKQVKSVIDSVNLMLALARAKIVESLLSREYNRVLGLQNLVKNKNVYVHAQEDVNRIKLVQSLVRGRTRQTVSQQVSRVTLFEALARSLLVSRKRGLDTSSYTTLGQTIAALLSGKRERAKLRSNVDSIIQIQSLCRGSIVLRATVALQNQKLSRIVLMQSLVRGKRSTTGYDTTMTRLLLLQAMCRSSSVNQITSKLFTQRARVTLVQALARGTNAFVLHSKNYTKVPILQAVSRGTIAKREMESLTITRDRTRLMQSLVRGEKLSTEHAKNIQRVYLMQAVCRGTNSTRSTSVMRRMKQDIDRICVLQSVIRGRNTNTKSRSNLSRIVLLQATIRAIMSKRLTESLLQERLDRIILVQSLVRGTVTRTSTKKNMDRITLVQALTRGTNILYKFEKLSKVVFLQAITRRQAQVHSLHQTKNQLTILQNLIRGSISRKHTKQLKDRYVILQSLVRSKHVHQRVESLAQTVTLEIPIVEAPLPVVLSSPRPVQTPRTRAKEDYNKVVLVQALIRRLLVPNQYTRIVLFQSLIRANFANANAIRQRQYNKKQHARRSLNNSNTVAIAEVLERLYAQVGNEPSPPTTPPKEEEKKKGALHNLFSKVTKKSRDEERIKSAPNVSVSQPQAHLSMPSTPKGGKSRGVSHRLIQACINSNSDELDLSNCALETIPYSMIELKHLKVLKLNGNNIRNIPTWFPDTFRNLETLDLSDNKLFTLPDMPPRLFHLMLRNNGFEYIPPQVLECLSLKSLDLSGNCLLNIPSDIVDLSNLKELDISNNNLMALPEEMSLLKLENLHLEGNDFLQSEMVRVKRLTDGIGKQKPQKQKTKNLFKNVASVFHKKEEAQETLSPRDDTFTYDPTFVNATNQDDITHFHDGEFTINEEGSFTDRSHTDSDPSRLMRLNTDWEFTHLHEKPTDDTPTTPSVVDVVTDTLVSPMEPSTEQDDHFDDEMSANSSPETSEIGDHTGDIDDQSSKRDSREVAPVPPPLELGRLSLKLERRPLEDPLLSQALPSTPVEAKVTPQEIKRIEQNVEHFRDRIAAIMEILESERKYVEYLHLLWDMYYSPMLEGKDKFRKKTDPEKAPVTIDVARGFFPPNLDAIIRFNAEFLQRLEDRFKIYINEPTGLYFMKVSDLFLVVLPYFKVYVSYLSLYERSMAAIRSERAKNKLFDTWLTKRKKQPASAGLDIQALLIMPVQRIVRYKLLLESLLKKTYPDHGDYEQLQQAIESVAEAANYQNQKIKDTNNIMRVHQIAQKLHMESLILPSRRVHREGVLALDSEKNLCDAYLFNDLILFEEKKRKMKIRPTIHVFEFFGMFIGGINELKVSINFNAGSGRIKKHDIVFPDDTTKKEWMEDLNRLMTEYRSVHRENAPHVHPISRKGSSVRSPRMLGSFSNMLKRVTTPRKKD
jgi:hypothetical protein